MTILTNKTKALNKIGPFSVCRRQAAHHRLLQGCVCSFLMTHHQEVNGSTLMFNQNVLIFLWGRGGGDLLLAKSYSTEAGEKVSLNIFTGYVFFIEKEIR